MSDPLIPILDVRAEGASEGTFCIHPARSVPAGAAVAATNALPRTKGISVTPRVTAERRPREGSAKEAHGGSE